MQTINSIQILGNVGAAAKVVRFENGGVKATLSVATNSGMGDNEKRLWHKVVFKNKAAEAIANLKAGDVVFVRGYLDYRKWADQNGHERISVEINALEFVIVKSDKPAYQDDADGFYQQEPQYDDQHHVEPQQAPAPQRQTAPKNNYQQQRQQQQQHQQRQQPQKSEPAVNSGSQGQHNKPAAVPRPNPYGFGQSMSFTYR